MQDIIMKCHSKNNNRILRIKKDAFSKLRKSGTDTSSDWDGECSKGGHFGKSVHQKKRQFRLPHIELGNTKVEGTAA